jgi:DnaJ-class molecular chaperone
MEESDEVVRQRIICEKCGGEGSYAPESSDGLLIYDVAMKCQACEGRGWRYADEPKQE